MGSSLFSFVNDETFNISKRIYTNKWTIIKYNNLEFKYNGKSHFNFYPYALCFYPMKCKKYVNIFNKNEQNFPFSFAGLTLNYFVCLQVMKDITTLLL